MKLEHARIAASTLEQLLVSHIFNDLAVLQNNDAVSHPHGGKTMRDEQGRFVGA